MKKYFLFSIILLLLSGLPLSMLLSQEKASTLSGEWAITIQFISGVGHHTAQIQQKNDSLSGIYKGELKTGALRGTVKGEAVDFTGNLKHEASYLQFHYTGTVSGDKMEGKVDMGEYWTGKWTAQKTKKR